MSEPGDKTKDISDIQPDRLIKYRVSDDRFSAEVLLPGLWYTDFDKKIGGRWTLQSMADIVEGARYVVERQGYCDHFELVNPTRTFFTTNSRIDISRTSSDITAQEKFGLQFPLLTRIAIVHVGNTSLTEELAILNGNTMEVLCSASYKYVYVDFETRKPTPLPNAFKERWEKSVKSKEPWTFSRMEPHTVPSNAHPYKVTPLYTDADNNDHVNQNIYLKWIVSAAQDAIRENALSCFKSDITKYPIESLTMQFRGEVNVTDDVTVCCWEDAATAKTLHFAIMNKGVLVNDASLKFHWESRL